MAKDLSRELSRLVVDLRDLISHKRIHGNRCHNAAIDLTEPDFSDEAEARQAHTELLISFRSALAENADLLSENRKLRKALILTAKSISEFDTRQTASPKLATAGSVQAQTVVTYTPRSIRLPAVSSPITIGQFHSSPFVWPPALLPHSIEINRS